MADTTPGDGTSTATTTGSAGGTSTVPANWDEVLATLAEPVRALYDAHTTGLRNTVQATRQERDALSGQLAALTKALGKETPEAAKAVLSEMASELEAANRRASFAEEAGKPEIGCTNPKAAFAIAQADGLFDKRGAVNWPALKTAAPELFRRPTPAGNAGQGTGTPPPATKSMNAFIRAAAGR